MTQLFARIELRGSPSQEIYQKLHQYMANLNWLTTISGTAGVAAQSMTVALPHATYQAIYNSPPTNLLDVANKLKSGIEANVWTKALILVIESLNWAETTG